MEHVLHVKASDSYSLLIDFDTGETRLFDMSPYLDKGVFKQLKDTQKFSQAYVAGGTVCWPGGLDIAPETLYDKSVLITTSRAVA